MKPRPRQPRKDASKRPAPGGGSTASKRPAKSEPIDEPKRPAKRALAVEPEEGFTDSVRLNKVIADAGVASRRHADDLIRNGSVVVNGMIVNELGTRVTLDDTISVNGEPITRTKHLTYVLLNKPKNYITTSSDELGRLTVFDIVKIHTRLFTVGRLDRNTTGVLLLTNDGDLAHRLMHPRYAVPRVYKAALNANLRADHARKIAAGVELEDGPTQPVNLLIDPDDRSSVTLEIHEGRNREVRRIFESLGYEVKRLDRKQYAFLTNRGLNRGEYRHLSREEVHELRRMVNLT